MFSPYKGGLIHCFILTATAHGPVTLTVSPCHLTRTISAISASTRHTVPPCHEPPPRDLRLPRPTAWHIDPSIPRPSSGASRRPFVPKGPAWSTCSSVTMDLPSVPIQQYLHVSLGSKDLIRSHMVSWLDLLPLSTIPNSAFFDRLTRLHFQIQDLHLLKRANSPVLLQKHVSLPVR